MGEAVQTYVCVCENNHNHESSVNWVCAHQPTSSQEVSLGNREDCDLVLTSNTNQSTTQDFSQ